MKRTLLLLALGVCLASPALAQQPSPSSGPEKMHGHMGGMGGLTDAERQELMAAHEAAIKADPTLETQQQALRDQMDALRKKMDAAMIKADPKVAPILAKIDAHKQREGGPGGPPPPPPTN